MVIFFFECERAMQTYIEPTQSYVTFITKTEAYYKKHIFGITLDDVRNLAINPVWLSCCCCVSELVVVVAVVVEGYRNKTRACQPSNQTSSSLPPPPKHPHFREYDIAIQPPISRHNNSCRKWLYDRNLSY